MLMGIRQPIIRAENKVRSPRISVFTRRLLNGLLSADSGWSGAFSAGPRPSTRETICMSNPQARQNFCSSESGVAHFGQYILIAVWSFPGDRVLSAPNAGLGSKV
ncbi:MAG TPA: hypothetical protein VGB07_14850 [Blastocatellia bacterium]